MGPKRDELFHQLKAADHANGIRARRRRASEQRFDFSILPVQSARPHARRARRRRCRRHGSTRRAARPRAAARRAHRGGGEHVRRAQRLVAAVSLRVAADERVGVVAERGAHPHYRRGRAERGGSEQPRGVSTSVSKPSARRSCCSSRTSAPWPPVLARVAQQFAVVPRGVERVEPPRSAGSSSTLAAKNTHAGSTLELARRVALAAAVAIAERRPDRRRREPQRRRRLADRGMPPRLHRSQRPRLRSQLAKSPLAACPPRRTRRRQPPWSAGLIRR